MSATEPKMIRLKNRKMFIWRADTAENGGDFCIVFRRLTVPGEKGRIRETPIRITPESAYALFIALRALLTLADQVRFEKSVRPPRPASEAEVKP
jgi:hypothetical protein